MRMIGIAVLAILIASDAHAILGRGTERQPDPFVAGAHCDVEPITTYGSYVYDWASKYDQVFEPHIYSFAKCPSSGYASFSWHFDTLTDTEKSRIAPFLNTHPWRKEFDRRSGFQAMLDQMEAIYELRDISRADRAYFYRTRVWYWKANPKADEYRRKALALHEIMLAEDNLQNLDLIQTLYVLGYYNWKLDNREIAEDYFDKASKMGYTDRRGRTYPRSDYFVDLIEDIRAGRGGDRDGPATKPFKRRPD